MVGLIKFNHMEKIMTLERYKQPQGCTKNQDYNYYTDPKVTHPDIKIDVPIPYEWESISYSNDLCPSFKVKDLQIFVMDDQTRDEEEFDHKYTIMSEENYGDDKPPFLATNSWDEVLTFVSLYKSLTKEKDNADK
tara:strand:- start:990 stop:1394 length:405 start_codon:yes stop_codon:yes gene_type:complete